MGRKDIKVPLRTDAAGLWDVAERGVTKLAARRTETNSNSKIREGNYPLASYLVDLLSIKKYSLVSKPPIPL